MTDRKTLDKAREWVEWVHGNPKVYGWTSDRARAAADLISSLPDTIVDADKLREEMAATFELWDEEDYVPPGLRARLEALLPVPAPRTLADMTPAECGQCGGPVEEDGFAAEVCPWGPASCSWCGSCYCDGSC